MSAVAAASFDVTAPLFTRSRAHAARLESMLASDEMSRKTHSELEEMGAALLRQLGMERSRSLDPPEAGLGDRKRVGDLTICIA